jgi:hypothetical protein
MFLPHVQKVIDEAMKKKTVEKRIDYLFKTLGEDKVCIKSAKELTVEELTYWADFFGLNIELKVKSHTILRRRRKCI